MLGECNCRALHAKAKKKKKKKKKEEISKLGYFFFEDYHNGFAIFHYIFILVVFEDTGLDRR